MKISNQSLIVLLVAVLALVGIAVWLVLRPPPPPKVTEITAEEKIVEAPPIVRRRSQSTFKPTGPVVVRAEEGRLVALECDGMRQEREISSGQATFETVPTKTGCSLNFIVASGAEELLPFEPVLPGDDVICRVDNLEVVCDGSLAEQHAGTIMAWSPGEGVVKIDGKEIGPVPINNYRLPVGKHKLEFTGKLARSSWMLTVRPDEQIEIMFSSPVRDETEPATPEPDDSDEPAGEAAATEPAPPAPEGAAAEGADAEPEPAGAAAEPAGDAAKAPAAPTPVDALPE